MATGAEVLSMLRPEGGWIIYGDDFDSIIYVDGCKPVTKTEFQNGFAQVDTFKAETKKTMEEQKITALTKLETLGLNIDDLKVLGLA